MKTIDRLCIGLPLASIAFVGITGNVWWAPFTGEQLGLEGIRFMFLAALHIGPPMYVALKP